VSRVRNGDSRAHNDPNYKPGWAGFFGPLALFAGFALVVVGLFGAGTFLRSTEPPRGGRLVGLVSALVGVLLVGGLALVFLGVRLL